MKCRRNIPCPMGGTQCCITCSAKDCPEQCSKQAVCFKEMVIPAYTRAGVIILLIGGWILAFVWVMK